MANNEAIRSVLKSGSGKALREFLETKRNELLDITNIKEIDDPLEQAIEVKASIRAFKKMDEVLKEIMDLSEEIKEKDPRDSLLVE